ncbi:methyl-accepting chemotaxis protein [Azomonas agilis]|uniref:Methyl-accepting chemotaxis protein n=1 Tax=Azomonas agilis TaxID=116849 RepID=A0A562HZX6_9GAMM|nr:methyl-accepting chemotaxis protein [Azomonas agilis]TWH64242.1 methyl-accepting chemotaxis protein [Azomonas agilis]
MSNLSVRARLVFLVSILLTSSILIGGTGLYGLKTLLNSLNTVYLDRVVPLRDLKIIVDLYAVNIVDASHKVRNGNFSYAEGLQELVKAEARINELWQAYLKTYLIAEERQIIQHIQPLMDKAREPLQRLAGIFKRQDSAALNSFVLQELYALIDPLSARFSELIEVQIKESAHQYAEGVAVYERNQVLGVGLQLLALVVGCGTAWIIIRQLYQQLGTEPAVLNQLARLIAQGNLSPSPDTKSHTGVLQSVDSMRRSLHDMIGEIGRGSTQIETAASELSNSTGRILEGCAQQSNTANSMAAAVEELSVSIGHIADNAQHAEQTAHQAEASSRLGAQVMQEAVAEITKIAEIVSESAADIEQLAEQSSNINSIVNVIRGIAEQTNLLALNAAIEAARAGEQGRGFAVVADEVRSLAARTAQSTTEIVALVSAIQSGTSKAKESMSGGREHITHGLQLVEEAGQSISTINQSMAQTLSATASIALALREQRAASDEVAINLERVVQFVAHNNEAIKGIAGSTQRLQNLGKDLSRLTQRFSL